MSLQSWMKEFYPKKPSKKMTWKEALEHSIRKWEGALPKNTKKHGVKYGWREVKDYWRVFEFYDDSCALCQKAGRANGNINCNICPIVLSGQASCASDVDNAYDQSSYNPRPMIRALKKALRWYLKKEGKL